MKTIWALWRRELRGASGVIGVVVVVVIVLDALLLAWGSASGNTTAFDRLLSTFAPAQLVVAALVAVRVFGGENQKGTWPLLSSLPVPARRVLGTKLAFVVVVCVIAAAVRVAVHAGFDAPQPSTALTLRVLWRATLFATFTATATSTLALLGRRFVLVGLLLFFAVPTLASLLSLRPLKDGPFGLVSVVKAVDDVGFGGSDAVVSVVVCVIFIVLFFAFGGKDLAGLKALALPWSSRTTRIFAAVLGLLLPLEVSSLRGPPNLVPRHLQVDAGRATFVDDGQHLKGARPLPQRVQLVAALQKVLDRLAVHGEKPRVLLVHRDDLDDPAGVDVLGGAADVVYVVEARKDATDNDVALALCKEVFDRSAPGVFGAGAAVVVANDSSTSPPRPVGVPRLLQKRDLDHGDVLVAEMGLDAAVTAAGFFVGGLSTDIDALVGAALDEDDDKDFADDIDINVDSAFAAAAAHTLTPALPITTDVVQASTRAPDVVRGVVVRGAPGARPLDDIRVSAALEDVLDRPRYAWRAWRSVDGAEFARGARVDAGFVSGDIVVVEVTATDAGVRRSSGRRRLVIP